MVTLAQEEPSGAPDQIDTLSGGWWWPAESEERLWLHATYEAFIDKGGHPGDDPGWKVFLKSRRRPEGEPHAEISTPKKVADGARRAIKFVTGRDVPVPVRIPPLVTSYVPASVHQLSAEERAEGFKDLFPAPERLQEPQRAPVTPEVAPEHLRA